MIDAMLGWNYLHDSLWNGMKATVQGKGEGRYRDDAEGGSIAVGIVHPLIPDSGHFKSFSTDCRYGIGATMDAEVQRCSMNGLNNVCLARGDVARCA